MRQLTRRKVLATAAIVAPASLLAWGLMACTERIIRVTRVVQVEKQVTKIVKQVVRETVIVEETQLVERTVEKVVTASPAPVARAVIVADVLDYGWTQFSMLMSPAFQEMFPNTVIRWRTLSHWQEYPGRIAAQQAAGNQGDLIEAPVGTLLAQWHRDGITRPVDDLFQAVPFDTSDMMQGVLAACTVAGRLVGIPFLGHAGENVLVYHRELFDRAGLAYPTLDWSIDDLRRAALDLTADRNGDGHVDQFGMAVRGELPGAYPALRAFGGSLLSKDGRNCVLAEKQGLAYLSWLERSVRGDGVAPAPHQIARGIHNMFLDGGIGMLRDSFHLAVLLERSDEAIPMGSTLFPLAGGVTTRGALPTGMAYAVSRDSSVARETLQWIKFISSREMGVQMFLGGYAEPGCRLASWQDERVLQRFPVASLVAEAANAAVPERLPWNLRTAECLAAWNEQVGQLLSGHLSPEDCASRICDSVDRVLLLPPL